MRQILISVVSELIPAPNRVASCSAAACRAWTKPDPWR